MIQRSLQGELPPAQESALHEHVESCPACAAAMEKFSGAARASSPQRFPTERPTQSRSSKRAVPWAKPEDIVFDPQSDAMQLGGWYRGGWFALFADQTTRWFTNETDPHEVRNLLTVSDPDGGGGTRTPPDPTGPVFVGNSVEVTGTTEGVVWGKDIYTADSNLGAAAVHAGLVAVGETRKLYIEVVEARSRSRVRLATA